MKVIIFTILVISCASVNGIHIQTAIFEDFPNQCSNETMLSPFVQIGENYYIFEDALKLNWFGAAHYCRTMGADLATIETEKEMEAISSHLLSQGYFKSEWFWISGNDLTTENEFLWLSSGKKMTYAKWSEGQPDNTDGIESCIFLWRHKDTFYMNDWECQTYAHFICEADIPKTFAITVW